MAWSEAARVQTMPSPVITLAGSEPAELITTLYHGAAYRFAVTRYLDDGVTPTPALEFANYQYRAAISDLSGYNKFIEATQDRDNSLARIVFTFSKAQILTLPTGSVLFDLVETDPNGFPQVRLRGEWAVLPGAGD